jgi:hypothetical protein
MVDMFKIPGYCADPGQNDNTRRLRKCNGFYGNCPTQASYYGTIDVTSIVKQGSNSVKVYAQDLCGGNLAGSLYLKIYKYDMVGPISSINANSSCVNNGQANTISWSASTNATYYTLLRDNIVIADNILTTNYVDTNPSGGNVYKVIAHNQWSTQTSGIVAIAKLLCPASLRITPISAEVQSEKSQQFSADVVYSDGSIKSVTNASDWSAGTSIGTMASTKGLFNAVKIDIGQPNLVGDVSVAYTEAGQTKTNQASVTVKPLSSINIVGDIYSNKNISGINVDQKSVIIAKGDVTVNSNNIIKQYTPSTLLQLAEFVKKMNLTINKLEKEYSKPLDNTQLQNGGNIYLNSDKNDVKTSSSIVNLKPEGKVWLVSSGDVNINSDLLIYGVGTIIIKNGNLNINGNIKYPDGVKSSIGFIIKSIGKNITVNNKVTELRGVFYAPNGKIVFN